MRIKAMSNLDRMIELASHGTSRAQGQVPAEREMKDVPVTEEPNTRSSWANLQIQFWIYVMN